MSFEVIQREDGTYRWRVRDENGEIVKITPGRIMLPPRSDEEIRRSRAAVQEILADRFRELKTRSERGG